MRARNLLGITLGVVFLVSWLSIVFSSSVQDFMMANRSWNGLNDSSQRLGIEVTPNPDTVMPEPGNSVLIIIPYLPYQDQELKTLVEFVNGGGTLLVMDDYGYGNQVLGALGLDMEFVGAPMLDPYINYRNQWLPLVTDLAPELKDAGIEQLVLNHATALTLSSRYKTLARSSDMSFIDINGNAFRDKDEPKGPFAVAARTMVGNGTVVAVSDPSILINSMVGLGDNDKFMKQIISQTGAARVALDTSHLSKAPLDHSKDAWAMARERLALPYSQVLLVGTVLTLSFMSFRGRTERSRN